MMTHERFDAVLTEGDGVCWLQQRLGHTARCGGVAEANESGNSRLSQRT